jgi:hypothetical protein
VARNRGTREHPRYRRDFRSQSEPREDGEDRGDEESDSNHNMSGVGPATTTSSSAAGGSST